MTTEREAKMWRLYGPILKWFRPKRMELFESIIEPRVGERILDVGGYPWTWLQRPQIVDRIDCVNTDPKPWDGKSAEPDYRITMEKGDGCQLEAEDESYDIVFSNSVIEHVGDWQKQVEVCAGSPAGGETLLDPNTGA